MKKIARTELRLLKNQKIPCYLEEGERPRIRFRSLTVDQIFRLAEVFGGGAMRGELVADEFTGLQVIYL